MMVHLLQAHPALTAMVSPFAFGEIVSRSVRQLLRATLHTRLHSIRTHQHRVELPPRLSIAFPRRVNVKEHHHGSRAKVDHDDQVCHQVVEKVVRRLVS